MGAPLAQFDEFVYYGFGLQVGVKNLLHNGFRLGLKKTAGKIFQPINSYSRFPEYWFIGREIQDYLLRSKAARPKILGVASPKCFGLYLASKFDADLDLTDIDAPSVQEAEILWNAVRRRAHGTARFAVEDARALNYAGESFDVVYSMSVIEHVRGTTGDSDALREMLRVLKPLGLLLVTVPFGNTYVEQERVAWEGARMVADDARYFFQRIYTPQSAEMRMLQPVESTATLLSSVSVSRKSGAMVSLYCKLGAELRGFAGFLNPWISLIANRQHAGIVGIPGDYGPLYRKGDVYGELMLAWRKNVIGQAAAA